MVKICYITPDQSGVSYHRIRVPFANLHDNYKDLHIVGANGFSLKHLPTQYDIIIFNRVFRQAEPYIEMAKEAGVKIIVDIDDWIKVPEYSLNHHGIETPIIERKILEMLDLADEVWTASDYLRQHLGRGVYIPNAIDFTQPQFIPQPQKIEKYTVGYIAGAAHNRDIELLFKGLGKLLDRKDYRVVVAGYSGDELGKNYWDYVTTVFTSGAKLDKRRFFKVNATDCYNYALSYNLCNVMLAPLVDDHFNRCKSNLKVLEAGAFGLPIICSNIEPYKEFISQGLVYSSSGNWGDRIKELIKNPKPGVLMGKRLNEYIHEHYDINIINKIRYNSILNLINK